MYAYDNQDSLSLQRTYSICNAEILHINISSVYKIQFAVHELVIVFSHQQQLLNKEPETGTRVPVSIPVGYPGN